MSKKDSAKRKYQLSLRRLYSTNLPCKEITTLIGIHRVGFILHIEKYLLDGMTFDNFGKVWSFDHIVPIDLFDLQNDKDLKLAYNYNNIMPMFNNDNRLKGASIHFSIIKLQSMENNIIINELLNKCDIENNKTYKKYLI